MRTNLIDDSAGVLAYATTPLRRVENGLRGRAMPVVPGSLGCGSASGTGRVNLGTGNLMLQISPPAAGAWDPRPVLTYNSTSTTATEFGYGWNGALKQSVTEVDSSTADVTKDTGRVLRYTNRDTTTGYYTPPDGARNALKKNADGTWTEMQPDGFELRYDSAGKLARFQSAAGSRWTLAFDAGSRPKTVTDPFGRLTSLAYSGGCHTSRNLCLKVACKV